MFLVQRLLVHYINVRTFKELSLLNYLVLTATTAYVEKMLIICKFFLTVAVNTNPKFEMQVNSDKVPHLLFRQNRSKDRIWWAKNYFGQNLKNDFSL